MCGSERAVPGRPSAGILALAFGLFLIAGSPVQAQQANRDKQADRAVRGIVPTLAEIGLEDAHVVAACTVGWTIEAMDGEPFPYSPENALRLWTDKRFVALRDTARDEVLATYPADAVRSGLPERPRAAERQPQSERPA